MAVSCSIAKQVLQNYVAGLRGSTALQQGSALVRDFMISNFPRHAGYAAGQAVQQVAEGVSQQLGSLAANLYAGATGTTPVLAAPNWKTMGQTAIGRAVQDAVTAARTGAIPGLEGYETHFTILGPANGVAQAAHDFIHRAYGAKDAYFQSVAYNNALESRAKELAMAEKAPDIAARTQQIVANAPDSLQADATLDSLKAIYANPNELTNAIRGVKSKISNAVPGGQLVATALAPFDLRPSNIALRSASYVPGSFIVSAAKNITNGDLRSLMMDLGRNGTGSAMLLAGMMLRKAGLIKGASPSGQRFAAENRMNDLENLPRTMAVKIGNRWTGLDELGYPALMLGLGATLHDAIIGQRQPVDAAAIALSQMTGRSALPSINEALQVGVPTNTSDFAADLQSFAAGRAASLTPALGNVAAKAFDPYQGRDTRGDTAMQTLLNTIQSRIPGLRNQLPPKLDAFGQPIPNAQGPIGGLLNPFPVNAERNTALVQEMKRVGVSLGPPSSTLKVGDQTMKLTVPEQRAFLTQTGPLIRQRLTDLIQRPDYGSMSKAEQKGRMLDIIRNTRGEVRDQLKARHENRVLMPLK